MELSGDFVRNQGIGIVLWIECPSFRLLREKMGKNQEIHISHSSVKSSLLRREIHSAPRDTDGRHVLISQE